MLIALVIALCVQCLILAMLCFSYKNIFKRLEYYESVVVEFFTQPDDIKEPSKFASMVDAIAANFSARIVSSAQAALRGSAGGATKAQNAEEQAVLVANNPLLGLLGGGKLGKSPMAMGILSMLGNTLFKNGDKALSTPGNGHSPKFKL